MWFDCLLLVRLLVAMRFQVAVKLYLKTEWKLPSPENGGMPSTYDNALRWMPQGLNDDKSTLVQVMAWCRQATSHYMNQCWPRSPTPYGVTRPQWVLNNLCGVIESARLNQNSADYTDCRDLQYISYSHTSHTVHALLCFVMVWYLLILPICFRVITVPLPV